MQNENPIFQLLVPSGNQALIAAGNKPDALAVGQLGAFNYHTGLSVDGSVLGDARDIYLAVGLDTDGDTVMDDIAKSAGQMIQVRHAKSLTLKPYITSIAQVTELTGAQAKCDTDYLLKIEIRGQQIYAAYGFNSFSKVFAFRTSCCTQTDCTTCPQGDSNELIVGLLNDINLDDDKLVVASLFVNILNATFAVTATGAGNLTITIGTETFVVAIASGDTPTVYVAKIVTAINSTTTSAYKASSTGAILSVYPKYGVSGNTALINLSAAGGTGATAGTYTVGNSTVASDAVSIAAFIAAHPGVNLSLRLTAQKIPDIAFNGNIPIKYYSSRDIVMIVSMPQGFSCNGKITDTVTMQYEDGNGRYYANEEFEAGGWNGKPGPYRQSAVTGLQRGAYSGLVSPTANYNVIVLEHEEWSMAAGSNEYSSPFRSEILVPCADATTLAAIATLFDLIFTQFAPMTNDVAANGGVDCTNVRTGLLAVATDGIEMLS